MSPHKSQLSRYMSKYQLLTDVDKAKQLYHQF